MRVLRPSNLLEDLPMRIFLAEDDPTTRHLLEKSLDGMDHDVKSFQDGMEAWEALQSEEAPQMAIVDWEMPRLNGIELVDKIRADPDLRSMYIMMLTIRDKNKDVMESFQIGVDDFLSKPLDMKCLRMGLEKGKRIIRSGMDFEERQSIIMDNVYDFFEGEGRLEKA
jgi:DNA-binding response OmpR family regulator